MTNTAMLVDRPAVLDDEDDFAPLDIKVVVAAHFPGKFTCPTSDGCGNTCAGADSSCNSYVEDPS